MKSFATLVELGFNSKPTASYFNSHSVGIYRVQIYHSNKVLEGSFWNTAYMVETLKTNTRPVDISQIEVGGDVTYTQVFSFDRLNEQDGSFYQYEENATSYLAIRFKSYHSPARHAVNFQEQITFANREWFHKDGTVSAWCSKQYANQTLKQVSQSDIEGNVLNTDILQTNEMSVDFFNGDGLFDYFENLYGNKFKTLQVFDGQDYSEAKTTFSGFVRSPEFQGLESVSITASDVRMSFSTELPKRVFEAERYPNLLTFPENVKSGADTIDTKRTLAAGRGVVVKLTPIKYFSPPKYTDATPEVVFEICDTSNHSIDKIVQRFDGLDRDTLKPHVWFVEKAQSDSKLTLGDKIISGDLEIFIPQHKNYGSGTEVVWKLDKEAGTLTFTGRDQVQTITDTKDNLYEIFVEVDIPPYTGLAFVREALKNYENISFISENYDVQNWTEAENNSREIAVVFDENNSQSILDFIGCVCFAEQGRFEIENNLIHFATSRERSVKYRFKQFKMGHVERSVDPSEYLSSCTISFDRNELKYKNTNYESAAILKHKLSNHEDFETILKHKSDVVLLSEEILQTRYLLKEYIVFEYYETLDNLRLFDLVYFEYKRDTTYFVHPCICEIVKLNIFDNVVKLRKVREA